MAFPIVAIGASAGGLEAVSELLAALPPKTDMAYVVIQHLAAGHESLMAELLAKKTPMPVDQVSEGMDLKVNQVYVIPPNTALTVEGTRLHLSPRQSEGPHHPVDVFFASLANSHAEAAVGIVLSGGDSDGSLGVQAIKHGGGITFAQQPDSARFPSMPVNAIATDCVDFVLPPREIARELSRLSAHPYLRVHPPESTETAAEEVPETREEDHLRRVFRQLRLAHGVDFTHYKRSTLRRRLARRMALRKVDALANYIAVLENDPAEVAALHQDFLIRVTSFFRDPETFESLRERVWPILCEGRSPKETLRIWVAGCASGEEVYSIAIALAEYLGERFSATNIQIFGSDVSEAAIERARAGVYLSNIIEELSPERLERFFVKQDGHYRIVKSLRDLCIFARQDVTRDPPFSRLDLVSCRNLLIYLDTRAQRRVMQVFHYALRPHGFLMLGPSETVGAVSDLFELTDKHHRFYTRKITSPGAALGLEMRSHTPLLEAADGSAVDSPRVTLEVETAQREADRLLLAAYAPASLLVDEELNILQVRGETGRYLELASGSPSLNLHRMARPELLVEISPAIQEAQHTGRAVHREGLALDDLTDITLRVTPLKGAGTQNCFFIVLEDASRRLSPRRGQVFASALPESEKDRRLDQLARELASTRDYMQAMMEGQEAVQEELKSAHEEVLSANEEFQSTNEELETAKEELQSTNEELVTTNEELRLRNRELGVLNVDLGAARGRAEREGLYSDAVVQTVREALLVIDENLEVVHANRAYYKQFDTTAKTIEGRSVRDLSGGIWSHPDFLRQLDAVLGDVPEFNDYELTYADPVRGARTLLLNARKVAAEPNRAALILLAIDDITDIRAGRDALRASDERFQAAVRAVNGIVWTNNSQGQMHGEQTDWGALTGQTYEEYQGVGWVQAVHPADAQPTLEAWQKSVAAQEPFRFEHRVRCRNGDWRFFTVRAIPVSDGAGAAAHWVGVHMDVTDLRTLERERTYLLEAEQAARTEAESANRAKDDFLATLSHELRTPITIVVSWSRMLLKKYGTDNEDLSKGLNLIINNTMTQAQLISDLLDMSSIVSGKTLLNFLPLDLRECVAQATSAQQLIAKDKGVELIVEPTNKAQMAMGDAGRLQQVIGNLLTNALKFTPAGGRITVQLQPVGDTIELSITDTGEGISSDFLPHIFDRFRQGNGSTLSGQQAGLGLGLAIVKQILELHCGSTRAESAGRGQGAKFTVCLPVRLTPNQEPIAETLSEKEGSYSDRLLGASILVVEDNIPMLEFLIRIFEERGAIVIGVRTASAALAALLTREGIAFNLLVSDIGLPGIDGYELMRRIRTELNLSSARLPAMAVTAFGRKEDCQRALQAGFQMQVAKPYDVSEVVAIARDLFQRKTQGDSP